LSNLYDHTHGGATPDSAEMIDFSVNISPLFPPLGPLVMEEKELIAYPSIDGSGIRDFYKQRFGLDSGSVLATNGAAEGNISAAACSWLAACAGFLAVFF